MTHDVANEQRLVKTVFVTGASAEFGAEITRHFVAGGARVVATARRSDRLSGLAQDVGSNVLPLALDVRDHEAVQEGIDGLAAEFAEVDVLVNNAGLSMGLEPAHRANLDDWEQMIDTNCKGLVFCTRALLAGMAARGRGHGASCGPARWRSPEPIGHCMKHHLPRRHTPFRPAHALAGLTIACAALLASAAWTAPTSGQSVLDRPPHLSDGWVVSPGVLQFNFLHRFQQSGPPDRKISASPSFHLGIGLPAQLMLGVQYATNSTVADRFPNEWQFFGRYAALSEEGASPVDLAVDAGYNLAARSIDGELALARTLGRVRLVTAARAFSNAYDDEDKDARFALGAGASLRITDNVALAGDFASLLDRDDGEEVAWGAGVQLQIPTTPHTLSLQVANTNTATLQGISVGEDRLRYGFEFTVPITLRRYLPRPSSPPVAAGDTADEDAGPAVERTDAGNVVRIEMEGLEYESERIVVPVGTTVEWTNEDPVMHTVTAEDESWNSGDIDPGESWERTFDEPGTYPYWCRPHPFMTAVIVVEP